MKKIVLVLMTVALLSLTGCNMIQGLLYKEYTKKNDVEKQIDQLEEKYKREIDIKVKDVQNKLENEIRRVANQDPRMIVNTVSAYPQENGILIEVELAVTPFNNAQTLSVFFNNNTNTAVIQ